MEQEKANENLDSWDSYASGSFLKASDVSSEEDAYVCTAVEEAGEEGNKKPRLTLERNEREYDFDLNKTNSKKLKELNVSSPKACIGLKIYFKKALVRNPQTNQEVEGLRIWKVESTKDNIEPKVEQTVQG